MNARLFHLLAFCCVANFAQQPAEPLNCSCPDTRSPDAEPGIVWVGSTGISLNDLASHLAPILWFSSDEPLLLRKDQAIPHAHPCDPQQRSPVVYFQATDIVLRGNDRVDQSPGEDPRFFEKVDHFVLRYFFYYDEDWGLRPHKHDLEVVNLYVHLERTREGCYRVRVHRVQGLAHGVEWYSNILNVTTDTVFPPTILVEEGKHASCPDRNADGIYTPGYDVNLRVHDAWGLRDVVGSSVLLGSAYSASMSKPRQPQMRLFPPESRLQMCSVRNRRTEYNPATALGRYELRPALAVPACSPPGPEPERLLSMMRTYDFGPASPARQYDSDLEKELLNPENVTRWVSAVNARLQSNRVGVIVQGPGFDMREFWLVPRAYVDRGTWFIDALVTPSASRWADWYVAGGFERLRRPLAQTEDTNRQVIRGFAAEIGMKFRVTVPGRYRWALLGYRFGGVRVGIRANGFTRVEQPRLVIELGAGAF